jgi:CubicO group peptidase (beta-lactamase class C family)
VFPPRPTCTSATAAISYVSTLLLILVDEKKVNLDDKVSKWLPDIPHSDEVTLGQLAQMTSGYTDYVIGNEEVDAQFARQAARASRRPGRSRLVPVRPWST